ncbi:MAG: hypothetical protein JOZ58_17205 [Acetobacteraceae bacterium]|nr:hypothetical protein [Acetobacteraceae bacterium]
MLSPDFEYSFFRVLPMIRQDARVTAERRTLFQHTDFSDIWKDAQDARTAFLRARVEALICQIRRALINQVDMGIASPSAHRNAGTPDAG